jgi:hypothetical protein
MLSTVIEEALISYLKCYSDWNLVLILFTANYATLARLKTT